MQRHSKLITDGRNLERRRRFGDWRGNEERHYEYLYIFFALLWMNFEILIPNGC